MHLTIGDKFFIPGVIHYLWSYINGCHICQLSRNDKPPVRQLQQRINLHYRPLSRLIINLKVTPKSYKSEVTNYWTTVPIYHSRSEEISNALKENVISKYCIPDYT